MVVGTGHYVMYTLCGICENIATVFFHCTIMNKVQIHYTSLLRGGHVIGMAVKVVFLSRSGKNEEK